MDFLNNALAQLRELFQSMTPGARVTAGLLLAVVVVSVGYLFQQSTTGPDEYLFGGEYLPSAQVDAIEAAISKGTNLPNYERVGNRIRVPRSQKPAFMAAISDAGALPPNFHSLLENALNSGGLMEGGKKAGERSQVAKQQLMSLWIRSMPGISDASVLYDIQKAPGFGQKNILTASVTVTPLIGTSLEPRRLQMIRKMVAGAISGMTPEDVVVSNLGDETYGSEGISSVSFEDPYYQLRVTFEEYTRGNIMRMLRIPGMEVIVSAELDPTIQHTKHEFTPDKQVATNESTSSEKMSSSRPAGGGQPGPTSQGPGRTGTSEVANNQSKSDTQSSKEDINFLVGSSNETKILKGLTPEKVTVTIRIPSDYWVNVWKMQNPPAAGQKATEPSINDLKPLIDKGITSIETAVTNILPRTSGENPYDEVKVITLQSLAPPEIVSPSLADNALAWSGRNGSTLAMCGLAVFSLMMLRSMVKAPPESENTAAALPNIKLETSETPSTTSDEEEETDEEGRPKLRLQSGPTLKDDLVEVVKEDPDAAAGILRNWIANAG